jgi:hypothetical protein
VKIKSGSTSRPPPSPDAWDVPVASVECERRFSVVSSGLFLLPHLEHRASVKRFVSLQFLHRRHSVGLFRRVISTSQGRYLTKTQNEHRHPCLELDSNPRSQRSSERRQFTP